jgi:hypothetical protein
MFFVFGLILIESNTNCQECYQYKCNKQYSHYSCFNKNNEYNLNDNFITLITSKKLDTENENIEISEEYVIHSKNSEIHNQVMLIYDMIDVGKANKLFMKNIEKSFYAGLFSNNHNKKATIAYCKNNNTIAKNSTAVNIYNIYHPNIIFSIYENKLQQIPIIPSLFTGKNEELICFDINFKLIDEDNDFIFLNWSIMDDLSYIYINSINNYSYKIQWNIKIEGDMKIEKNRRIVKNFEFNVFSFLKFKADNEKQQDKIIEIFQVFSNGELLEQEYPNEINVEFINKNLIKNDLIKIKYLLNRKLIDENFLSNIEITDNNYNFLENIIELLIYQDNYDYNEKQSIFKKIVNIILINEQNLIETYKIILKNEKIKNEFEYNLFLHYINNFKMEKKEIDFMLISFNQEKLGANSSKILINKIQKLDFYNFDYLFDRVIETKKTNYITTILKLLEVKPVENQEETIEKIKKAFPENKLIQNEAKTILRNYLSDLQNQRDRQKTKQ